MLESSRRSRSRSINIRLPSRKPGASGLAEWEYSTRRLKGAPIGGNDSLDPGDVGERMTGVVEELTLGLLVARVDPG